MWCHKISYLFINLKIYILFKTHIAWNYGARKPVLFVFFYNFQIVFQVHAGHNF